MEAALNMLFMVFGIVLMIVGWFVARPRGVPRLLGLAVIAGGFWLVCDTGVIQSFVGSLGS